MKTLIIVYLKAEYFTREAHLEITALSTMSFVYALIYVKRKMFKNISIFSLNGFNIFSFYDADHGPKNYKNLESGLNKP